MQQLYCKMSQLLQIATTLLQNATFITKCNIYYKLQQCKHFTELIEYSNTG